MCKLGVAAGDFSDKLFPHRAGGPGAVFHRGNARQVILAAVLLHLAGAQPYRAVCHVQKALVAVEHVRRHGDAVQMLRLLQHGLLAPGWTGCGADAP